MSIIPAPATEDEPRIYVRDETDIRVLILALSLFSGHTHSEALGTIAEELTELLAQSPRGVGYSSRHAPAVAGASVTEKGL